jgi:hypothetical protein
MGNVRPFQKRPRPVKSCLNCRKDKRKCDRGQPCTQCVKSRNLEPCTYDERAGSLGQIVEGSAMDSNTLTTPARRGRRKDPVRRLRTQVSKLESLIQEIESSSPPPSPVTELHTGHAGNYHGLQNTRSLIALVCENAVVRAKHLPSFMPRELAHRHVDQFPP